MKYGEEEFADGKGRPRNGSPMFYQLLYDMAELHDRKSHDYASNQNPSGNYHFAGQVSTMFSHSPQDAGFVGRIAEKIYRLSNLESGDKTPKNESVEDTENDIAVITLLWMADRRVRREKSNPANTRSINPDANQSSLDFGVSNAVQASQPQPADPLKEAIKLLIATNNRVISLLGANKI